MAGASSILDGRSRVVAPAVAGVVAIAVMAWLATWTGDAPTRGLDLAWVLLGPGARAAVWLASAWGLGFALVGWCRPGSETGPALRAPLGVAALLLLDNAAGRLGLLQAGGAAGAWLLLAPGLGALLLALVRGARSAGAARTPAFWLVAAAPPVAVLLVAASSAPGWLWASEFGGYDALSYHLQLPREWWTLGRIQGLEHNVYAHLPSGVEAAYYHVFVLGGGDRTAAFAAQLLHAGMALLTAGVVHAFATRHGGRAGGAAATLIVLATPWVIVAGSLAYNEMAVALFLAATLLLLDGHPADEPVPPAAAARTGLALGLLVGAACSAKLTSVGFVALPAFALLVTTGAPWRRTLVTAGVTAAAMLVVLAPWLIANAIETGNPVFPFLPRLLGTGAWSAEQAATWAHGHRSDLPPLARLAEGWRQLLRYGIGPVPAPGEPWAPQWSITPWLTLGAAAVGLARRDCRRITTRLLGVMLLQTLFWLLFTHVKSRFMLPAVVPAALLVGVAAGSPAAGAIRGSALALLAALALLPLALFAREAGRAPSAAVGAIAEIGGEADAVRLADPRLDEDQRRAILAQVSPVFWVNHRLPPGARVLGVGEAAPFYYRPDLVYGTTWDRGPLSRVMRAHPDDPAAWLAALRTEGFTHLLVNATMLDVWERAGWNDPLVTTARVLAAADAHAVLEHRWAYGVVLYRLEEGTEGLN